MKQAATASAVYRDDILPSLPQRQAFVREQLRLFLARKFYAPTAMELLQFVSARHPDRRFDVNSIRPRLCELEVIGWVRHAGQRNCSVTKKTVLTWEVSTPAPAAQNLLELMETPR